MYIETTVSFLKYVSICTYDIYTSSLPCIDYAFSSSVRLSYAQLLYALFLSTDTALGLI